MSDLSDFDTEELAILHAVVIGEREFKEDIGEKDAEYIKLLVIEKKLKEMIIPPEVEAEANGWDGTTSAAEKKAAIEKWDNG